MDLGTHAGQSWSREGRCSASLGLGLLVIGWESAPVLCHFHQQAQHLEELAPSSWWSGLNYKSLLKGGKGPGAGDATLNELGLGGSFLGRLEILSRDRDWL